MTEPLITQSSIQDDFIGCFETNHPQLPVEKLFNYLDSNGLIGQRSEGQESIRDSQALLNRVAQNYFNNRLIAPPNKSPFRLVHFNFQETS